MALEVNPRCETAGSNGASVGRHAWSLKAKLALADAQYLIANSTAAEPTPLAPFKERIKPLYDAWLTEQRKKPAAGGHAQPNAYPTAQHAWHRSGGQSGNRSVFLRRDFKPREGSPRARRNSPPRTSGRARQNASGDGAGARRRKG